MVVVLLSPSLERFLPGASCCSALWVDLFLRQVTATVQALEAGGDPVVVAINAASAALCVSNIPWDGPAGCVRIGRR